MSAVGSIVVPLFFRVGFPAVVALGWGFCCNVVAYSAPGNTLLLPKEAWRVGGCDGSIAVPVP